MRFATPAPAEVDQQNTANAVSSDTQSLKEIVGQGADEKKEDTGTTGSLQTKRSDSFYTHDGKRLLRNPIFSASVLAITEALGYVTHSAKTQERQEEEEKIAALKKKRSGSIRRRSSAVGFDSLSGVGERSRSLIDVMEKDNALKGMVKEGSSKGKHAHLEYLHRLASIRASKLESEDMPSFRPYGIDEEVDVDTAILDGTNKLAGLTAKQHEEWIHSHNASKNSNEGREGEEHGVAVSVVVDREVSQHKFLAGKRSQNGNNDPVVTMASDEVKVEESRFQKAAAKLSSYRAQKARKEDETILRQRHLLEEVGSIDRFTQKIPLAIVNVEADFGAMTHSESPKRHDHHNHHPRHHHHTIPHKQQQPQQSHAATASVVEDKGATIREQTGANMRAFTGLYFSELCQKMHLMNAEEKKRLISYFESHVEGQEVANPMSVSHSSPRIRHDTSQDTSSGLYARLAMPQHRNSLHSNTINTLATEAGATGSPTTSSATAAATATNAASSSRSAKIRHTISQVPKSLRPQDFDFYLDGMTGEEIVMHMVQWTMQTGDTNGLENEEIED